MLIITIQNHSEITVDQFRMSTHITLIRHQTCSHQKYFHTSVAAGFTTVDSIGCFYLIFMAAFFTGKLSRTVINDIFGVARLTFNY